jgi:hypothetical protein
MAESKIDIRMAFTAARDMVTIIVMKGEREAITAEELLASVKEFIKGSEEAINGKCIHE